jgi:uncharacterized protein (TIGR03435 family)
MIARSTLSRCVIVSLSLFVAVNQNAASARQAPVTAAQTETPSFEVASIKPSRPDDTHRGWDDLPGRISIENYTLRQIIMVAYGLKSDSQVTGGPKWIDSLRFDIAAKADDTETEKMQKMTREQSHIERSLMLQSLLADRFQLKLTRSQQIIRVYALVIVKSGIKFTPASVESDHHLSVDGTHMTASGISMDVLADYLTGLPESGNRLIVNQTGLTGNYDFKLNWTRDRGIDVPPDAPYPGLFTAIHEQLGLKIESRKGSVPVVNIGSAVEPAFD